MATSPVRMPAGINNVSYTTAPDANGETNYNGARNTHPLFMFPSFDPFRLILEADDFVKTPNAASYVTTVVGTGTAAVIAGLGGILQLNTSATLNDSVSWQHSPSDTSFTSTLQGWFHCLVKPQDSTLPELLIGMTNSTTTPLTATDGFYFHKAAGSQNVDLVFKNASVVTTIAAIGVMADLTSIKLSLYYNGKGELAYYVNSNKVGSTTNTAAFPLASVGLATTFYIANGAAATKYLSMDYYMTALESTR